MPTPVKCLLTSMVIAIVAGFALEVRGVHDDAPGVLIATIGSLALLSIPAEIIWWVWC